jgi:hypothetical protein
MSTPLVDEGPPPSFTNEHTLDAPKPQDTPIGAAKEDLVIARIATFEGGDAAEMYRINNEMLVTRSNPLPPGVLRVMVLKRDETSWSVVSFFENEESAGAAEARFEEMGDEIPERVRGKRVGLETYEVAFDVEMVRT